MKLKQKTLGEICRTAFFEGSYLERKTDPDSTARWNHAARAVGLEVRRRVANELIDDAIKSGKAKVKRLKVPK